MNNSVWPRDDAAAALRELSDAAADAVHATDGLAQSVLQRSQRRRNLRRMAIGIGTSLVVVSTVAAVRLGHGDFFTVRQPSQAMDPTVRINERVVFSKVADPQSGDVVYAHPTAQGTEIDIISRVMAQSGDTIACPAQPDGSCDAVLVNGQPVADTYLRELVVHPFGETVVPDGSVFILGDDRAVANDSRYLGPIDIDDIDGVAVQILDNKGHARAVPGATTQPQPDDSDLIDPADQVPPASTVTN